MESWNHSVVGLEGTFKLGVPHQIKALGTSRQCNKASLYVFIATQQPTALQGWMHMVAHPIHTIGANPRPLVPCTHQALGTQQWQCGDSSALPPALHAVPHQHFLVTGSLISNVARDITALLNLPVMKPSAHCQDDTVPSGSLCGLQQLWAPPGLQRTTRSLSDQYPMSCPPTPPSCCPVSSLHLR